MISRMEAPELIFVVFIFVTGSPDLTYDAHINHTPLGSMSFRARLRLPVGRRPFFSFVIAMQILAYEGITFIVKLVFMNSFHANDGADRFAVSARSPRPPSSITARVRASSSTACVHAQTSCH